MNPLIPAADLEPTAEQTARARRDFAACADYTETHAELSISTVHVEALAVALAAGDMRVVTARVREMLAVRRAYVERRTELAAAAADEAGSLPRSRVPGATWAAWRRSTVTPGVEGDPSDGAAGGAE
ncbi:hypothetical protein FMEAI12_3560011 [Parafrankia sp. Ea1.12]|uniref:hypothetical protein n=1 Tax=Parafrankia sp. Ea1.12 TaxID=573499 RepID=UPI000DA5A8B8|nr:hypothetical protein [Parafrankia sp. Ea1.12]SQD96266.1 hypothetical protein FMEAI12_3560011 [Parafrankia sp. Ea1.12]